MTIVLRFIAAVVLAIVVAIALLIAVELFSAVVHPTPSDFDGTMEQMCEHVARYPAWVLVVVIPMWGFIAWLSTWVAQRVGGRAAAILIGVLLLAAVILNISMLPYPLWFKIACVVVISIASLLGCRLVGRSERNVVGTNETSTE